MALLFALTAAAIGGIWFGVKREKRSLTVASMIVLLVIWILAGIYLLIARQNPY